MARTDGRTPVLVGAAAVQQHTDDPLGADDAAHLMAHAVEGATADAGATRSARPRGARRRAQGHVLVL